MDYEDRRDAEVSIVQWIMIITGVDRSLTYSYTLAAPRENLSSGLA